MWEKYLPDKGQTCGDKGAGAGISLGVDAFASHLYATELTTLEAVDKFL